MTKPEDVRITAVSSMMLTSMFAISTENYRENYYINNVTRRADLFENFNGFGDIHSVTTPDGSITKAEGKGNIQSSTVVNGKPNQFYLRDVWYVPGIKRDLLSMLVAQDMNLNSVFESHEESCMYHEDWR